LKKIFIAISFLSLSLFATDAVVDIEKSATSQVKMAVESFNDSTIGSSEKNMIDAMVLKDIMVTDHLKAVSTEAIGSFDIPVDPHKMAEKNAKVLLRYKSYKSLNGFSVESKIFDTSGKLLLSNKYQVPTFAEYPFAVHKMAVDLNNLVKAPPVDWMQKFVILSKDKGAKRSDIIVSDYTLTYQKTIISGGYNIFPIWGSNDQSVIYYTAYDSLPTLYRYEIYTGKKTKIISSQGMLVCSDVSKDGTKLLLTMAPGALPDVYLYDTITKQKKNISNFQGIDVNGNFLDHDTKVAFVSDRLGSPTIFAKKIDSPNVEQLVFAGKNSSFSAKDNFLVYNARENGDGGLMQNIFHLDTNTRQLTKLTNSGWNTMPKVSQNGDAIMFVKNDHGRTYLGVIRLNSLAVFLFPMNIGRIKSFNW
jgi:TolB protein